MRTYGTSPFLFHGKALVACAAAILAVVVSDGAVPQGYVSVSSRWGWNAEDATASLQAALDSGERRICVDRQSGDWIVRPLTLRRSDLDLVFEDGVTLRAKKGEFLGRNDALLRIELSARRIALRGEGTARFVMNKRDYQSEPYRAAEWRHTLSVYGSDVVVSNLTLESSGGDGVYVWAATNVVLRDLVCRDHHRQGISVISASNLLVRDCSFSETDGTAPMCGCDIEPNEPAESFENVVFDNCDFFDNSSSGVSFYFGQLLSSTPPVSVTFRNCRSYRNRGRGFAVKDARTADAVGGWIVFDGCRSWSNTGSPLVLQDVLSGDGRLRVAVSNCWFDARGQSSPGVDVRGSLSHSVGNFSVGNTDVLTDDGAEPIAFTGLWGSGVKGVSGSLRACRNGVTNVIDLAAWAAGHPEDPDVLAFTTRPYDCASLVPVLRTRRLPSPVSTGRLRGKSTFYQHVPGAGEFPIRFQCAVVNKRYELFLDVQVLDETGRTLDSFRVTTSDYTYVIRSSAAGLRQFVFNNNGCRTVVTSEWPGCGVDATQQNFFANGGLRTYFSMPSDATGVRVMVLPEEACSAILSAPDGTAVDALEHGTAGRVLKGARTPGRTDAWGVAFPTMKEDVIVKVGAPALPVLFPSPESGLRERGQSWSLRASCVDDAAAACSDLGAWVRSDGTVGRQGQPLGGDDDFEVSSGRALRLRGGDFAGASLSVGSSGGGSGGTLLIRDGSVSVGDLVLCNGRIDYSSEAEAIGVSGRTTVLSTSASPFAVVPAASGSRISLDGRLFGDSDALIALGSADGACSNAVVSIADPSAYLGNIEVRSGVAAGGHSFGQAVELGGDVAGAVILRAPGTLVRPRTADRTVSVGELSLASGAQVGFTYDPVACRAGTLSVERSLAYSAPVAVQSDFVQRRSTTGEEVRCPVLVAPAGRRLRPADFLFVPDPRTEPGDRAGVCPQRVHFEVETDRKTDRDTLYAVVEPIVELVRSDAGHREWDRALANGSALFKPASWSDGRTPHAFAHYLVGQRLHTEVEHGADCEFPGRSLLLCGGTLHFFGRESHFRVGELHMAGTFRQCQWTSMTLSCGRLHLCAAESVRLKGYSNQLFTIDADIDGDSDILLEGEYPTGSPRGRFVLAGANTNWFGAVSLPSSPLNSDDDGAPYSRWSLNYLTLQVNDGRNLGGRLGAFNFKAVELHDHNELLFADNVTLPAEANRGIFVTETCGRLTVADGKTCECRWPLTVDATVYKTGAGTLALGGGVRFLDADGQPTDALPADGARRTLVVTNGVLKALSADCVNGLTVSLADRSDVTLAIDFDPGDAELRRFGFRNDRTDDPFAGRRIRICLLGATREGLSKGGSRHGLLTVRTSVADRIAGLLDCANPFSAEADVTFAIRRTDDRGSGLTTFSACFNEQGLLLMLQ